MPVSQKLIKPGAAFRLVICVVLFFGVASVHASDGWAQKKTGSQSWDLKHARQVKQITPRTDLPLPGEALVGDRFYLDLFDKRVLVVIDRVAVNQLGTKSIRGRLKDYPKGYFILSSTGNKSFGSLRIPEMNREYTISYDAESYLHYLSECDQELKDVLETGAPLLTPVKNAATPILSTPILSPLIVSPMTSAADISYDHYDDENVVIRILVVYTPKAREWAAGNTGGIDLLIAQAMEKLQLASDNSRTATTFELARAAEVFYDETGGASSDHLKRLQDPGDGYMDEVHEMRDQYAADLVALLANVKDLGGISYQLTNASGDPDYSFSLTRVQQAASTYTFAHEIGHNLGLGHHKQQLESGHGGLFSYSAGWRWPGKDGYYTTIMAYPQGSYYADGINSTNLPYFSNPDIYHEGNPTGHPLDGDNARTLREVRHVIAGYRPDPLPAPVILKFTTPTVSIREGETTIIEWLVENADEVFIETDSGSEIVSVDLEGEREVAPSEDTIYTLTAVNENGQETKSITVIVSRSKDFPFSKDSSGGCFISQFF